MRQAYDEGGGGGFAIFIPSLGRERDILPARLDQSPAARDLCRDLALGTLVPLQSPSPEQPPAVGSAADASAPAAAGVGGGGSSGVCGEKPGAAPPATTSDDSGAGVGGGSSSLPISPSEAGAGDGDDVAADGEKGEVDIDHKADHEVDAVLVEND